MPKINKIYLISRLSKDNVVKYDNGMTLRVNVSKMIELIDNDGANLIKVFVKDADSRLMKRIDKLIDNTLYGYGNAYIFGFTDELATLEDYATNYYVFDISKQVLDITPKELEI